VKTKVLAFSILSVASTAFCDDFKTVNGKEYRDATITRVDPDGIVVKSTSGVSKIYFVELPTEVQQRFHYEPQKASAYSTQEAANYSVYQKQQDEAKREQENAAAKQRTILAEQEAAKNRTQALQARYDELQKQEDDLLLRIGEAQQPGPAYRVGKKLQHQPNPQKSQLPVLKSHLSDVRKEKNEVRKQLGKAQR
jgi:hypothetical protein